MFISINCSLKPDSNCFNIFTLSSAGRGTTGV